jgi:hypothetical protein
MPFPLPVGPWQPEQAVVKIAGGAPLIEAEKSLLQAALLGCALAPPLAGSGIPTVTLPAPAPLMPFPGIMSPPGDIGSEGTLAAPALPGAATMTARAPLGD